MHNFDWTANTRQQDILQSQQQQQHQSQQDAQEQSNLQQQQPPHMMPVPSAAPWNMYAMPWKLASPGIGQLGTVMQFSAPATLRRTQLHQKRKSDLNDSTLPAKQFISEEKITAHFNGLHISSDYIQHANTSTAANTLEQTEDEAPATSGKSFTNLTYQDYQITAKELEEKLRNASSLTMCNEIKKFHEEQKKVSFLPEALLNRIEKPCTALVLWQPSPLHNFIECHQRVSDRTNREIAIEEMPSNEENAIDTEIIDFADNNNTCSLDFNNAETDVMDEDL